MPLPTAAAPELKGFAAAVVRWQKRAGRHGLPWQLDNDPYKIWVSEIMLQQTQVAAVIPYYQKFMRRFPSVAVLARARQDSVLAMWSGLGYYARARNLHKAAKIINADGFPDNADGWRKLPGVGNSTAAAIAVFSSGARCAILDGNVKRVLARVLALPLPPGAAADRILWDAAAARLPPKKNIRPYTQGLMDLGATVCLRRNPRCGDCPLSFCCLARRRGRAECYPPPKAKKEKPLKHAELLLIVAAAPRRRLVLLQRRPSRGIWGGLWSLPESENGGGVAARRQWEAALACALSPQPRLAFEHQFTHYRLRATVWVFESAIAPLPPPSCRWFGRRQWEKAGLPAPVRTLLERIG